MFKELKKGNKEEIESFYSKFWEENNILQKSIENSILILILPLKHHRHDVHLI